MSLLHMDGFDYVSDNLYLDYANKWINQGTFRTFKSLTIVGRNGVGKAIAYEALVQLVREFADRQEVIVGFAFKTGRTLGGPSTPLTFRYNGTDQFYVGLTDGGHLGAQRTSGTYLAVSDKILPVHHWSHIEVRYKIAESPDGSIEIRVNGEVWINLSGIDTQRSGSANLINEIELVGSNGTILKVDDFYLLDTNGSRLNDFLGDCTIETLYPTAVGAHSDFTPLAGTNWEAVDDVIPDRDTTYVEDSAAGAKDRHIHGNLATTPSNIHAVAVNPFATKVESGSRVLRTIAYDGVTEGEGADQQFDVGTYSWEQQLFEDHPSGAAQWTAAEVNAGEFGYRISP